MTIEESIASLCQESSFAGHNHMSLKEWEKDRAVMELTVQPDSLNQHKITHGGALFTLADCAAGVAALTDGRPYVTISSNLNFLRSSKVGDHVLAEAKIIRRGRSTCYALLDIVNDKGELLANGNFSYFCIG